MVEAHLDLASLRCPRCSGQLVLRVVAEEQGRGVLVTLDSACVACGISPWTAPDERTMVFTPGASISDLMSGAISHATRSEEAEARLAAAQARIDGLLRRIVALENSLAAAQRNLTRAEERHRKGDVEAGLREEISHLEGELAQARAEVRRGEEATRGELNAGKRPIEIE